jgi:antirestriction protein
MNEFGEDNHDGESRLNDPATPETARGIVPKIYVASLSDYNAGHLHGAWIEADVAREEVEEAIQDILKRSPTGNAEEFAIFDFEGFGRWRPDEYEPIAMVAAVAQGIAKHGVAFGHWVAVSDASDPDQLNGFEDVYLGHWDSAVAYVEDLMEGIGVSLDAAVPEVLSPYVRIDHEAIARDLELSGVLQTSEGDGGVYVFVDNR